MLKGIMRVVVYAWPLWLLLFAGAASAQSTTSQTAAREAHREDAANDEKKYFALCMNDWDVKTHMSKRQWERTCRRVTEQRLNYLREHGYLRDSKKSRTHSVR